MKHITWEVCNGASASFWEDSWDGHQNLFVDPSLMEIRAKTTRVWGSKVCNYREVIKINGFDKWCWKYLENINVPQNQKEILANILKERSILVFLDNDKIRWYVSKDKKYKVKLGYCIKEAKKFNK